jgi:hypothetical protein
MVCKEVGSFLSARWMISLLALVTATAAIIGIVYTDGHWIKLSFGGQRVSFGWRKMRINDASPIDIECTNPAFVGPCEDAGLAAGVLVITSLTASATVLFCMIVDGRFKGTHCIAFWANLTAFVTIIVAWSEYYLVTIVHRFETISASDYRFGSVSILLIVGTATCLLSIVGTSLVYLAPDKFPYSQVQQRE